MGLSRLSNDADGWIALIFDTKAARTGGVVRRNVSWVQAEIGEARLIEEVRKRGFHMVRSRTQYVIFCHADGIRLIC